MEIPKIRIMTIRATDHNQLIIGFLEDMEFKKGDLIVIEQRGYDERDYEPRLIRKEEHAKDEG
jgi:hypothetical protein